MTKLEAKLEANQELVHLSGKLGRTIHVSKTTNTDLAQSEWNSQHSPNFNTSVEQMSGDTPVGDKDITEDKAVGRQTDSSDSHVRAIKEQAAPVELGATSQSRYEQYHDDDEEEEELQDNSIYEQCQRDIVFDAPIIGDHEDNHDLAYCPRDPKHSLEILARDPASQPVLDLTESPLATGCSQSRNTVRSATSILAPTHESRVSKPKRPRRQRQPWNPNAAHHSDAKAPTTEDLCFILMSRVREQNESRKRVNFLEHETKNLRREKLQSDAEMQQAMNAHDALAQDYEILVQDLDTFRGKYYKLKKWALETNKDCEILQGQASGFRKVLHDLTEDRDQLRTQLHDVRSSSDSASEHLHNVRNGVREAKLVAEERLAGIAQLDAIVTKQDEQLRDERQKSKRYEMHIHHLESERGRQNRRIHDQQQALNVTLQAVCEKLVTLQNGSVEDNSEKSRMVASLTCVQAVLDNDLAKKSDVVSLKNDIVSTATSVNDVEHTISEKVQLAVDSLKNHLQQDVSSQTTMLLSAIQSDDGQLLEAKTQVARLEQKALQTEEMVNVLKEARTAADKNAASLQKMTEKLREDLSKEKVKAQEQINLANDRFNHTLAKYQSASSSLEKSKDERNEAQAKVNDLFTHLAEATGEQNRLRSELTKAEELIVELQQHEQEDIEKVCLMSLALHDRTNFTRWTA